MNRHLLIMGTRMAPLPELLGSARGFSDPLFASGGGDAAIEEFLSGADPEKVIPLQWRPGSTLSTRAAVAAAHEEARSREGELDSAILLIAPPREHRGFHEISPGELERILQDTYAGAMYFLREITASFTAAGKGSLTVILDEHNSTVLPPLAAGVMAGIQRTVDGLFRTYRDEPVIIQGLRSSVDEPEQLAQYVFNEYLQRPEKTGFRWTKYTGKTGLFGKKG